MQVTTGARKPSAYCRSRRLDISRQTASRRETGLWEFRLDDGEGEGLAPGSTLIDVTAFTT